MFLAALVLTLGTLAGVPAFAQAAAFTNANSIALRDPSFTGNPNCVSTPCLATAGTYPSTISVSGQTGTLSNVSVSLNNVSYSYSEDIDALLVAPSGQSLILVAGAGPDIPSEGQENASNNTLTISDSGTLPTDTTSWSTNPTWKPVNFGSYGLGNNHGNNEDYVSPAPAQPWGDPGTTGGHATLGNTFDGLGPDGTWSLYVITTQGGDGTGAIAGGWTLNLTTAAAAAPTTTMLTSSPNPSFTSGTSSSVTLTSATTSSATVNAGTVNFTDGGVTIAGCGAQPVNASGVATCTTTFTTEGDHSLEALYGGTASFAQSNGTLTQQVNDHTTVTGSSYCNTGAITLENPPSTVADAAPYPSRVFVSGLSGTVGHLSVTLNGVSYADSQDIDALLVGPGGQSLILVADAGPNTPSTMTNVTLTLDDNATTTLGQLATWGAANSTVTSKPVNYGGDNETFGTPAPAGPYGNPGPNGGGTATLGTQFNGINPNGTWSLYLITTAAGDGTGSVAGGWCASVTTSGAAGTNTTISSNNNPSFTASPNNSVTFTATVTKASDNSNVNEGTVDFTSNGVTIPTCGAVAVSNGTATCATSFTQEGSDTVEALYSGDTNFGPSNASLTQTVNDHTTVTGNNYCNTGAIALENPASTLADAVPYPSNIFVTGRPGNLQHLSVTLKGVTYRDSQDIDALLVGPGGQSLILVADAGPNTPSTMTNVTLTLDDNATTTLGQLATWGAANSTVTSKPVNYGGFNETFGAPAPAPPWGNPGPFAGGTATLGGTYNGTSPNGTWLLYLITTAAGDGTGSVGGGWCMNVTTPSPPTLTKTFGASSIPLNGSTSLSFTVTNPNASTSLTGVDFTDTLPSGLTLATPAGESGTCGGGTITATNGGTAVELSGATLAAGASCTFSVNVTGIAAGSQVNTTSAPASTEGGSGTAATATLLVVAPPVLSKSFSPTSIALGSSSTLTFTIQNPQALSSLSGIGFTDTLPSGLVVTSPNGLNGSCGAGTITATAGGTSISLSGAALAASATCTFSVGVTATSIGTKTNTTSVVSSNEGGSGTAATATLTVNPAPPQIAKSFGDATIPLDGSTTLTFTLSNPAGNGLASGVGFTDDLPAGLVVATPNGATTTCGGTGTAIAGASTVSLADALVADGSSCTLSVNVTGTTAGVKNNSVTVSSTSGGTGNTATASVTVVAPPTLSKSFAPTTIALNGSTTLSFTVTNPNSGTSLTGVGFTDTLPTGLAISTPNQLTGSCGGGTLGAAAGGTSISLSGATLAATASCTFSVSVDGTDAGSYTNTTSAPRSTEGGSGTAATAMLTVEAGPQMIAKSFGATTIPLNGSTTLSFTITNPAANGTATGIQFTDTLPSGLVVSTPNGLTGSCGSGTITATAGTGSVSLSGATLSGGGSCTFSVSVTGITAGVQNNSVTVSSATGGTGNTATASVTIVAPPTVTKAFGARSVPLNGTTSLSFTIANPNATVDLGGVGLTDDLPAGITAPPGTIGSCGAGTAAVDPTGTTITLTGGTIAAGGSCTFSVNVTGTEAGSWTNTTDNVTSTEGGTGGAASDTLDVVAPPHIDKAFGDSSVPLNGTTSLTFTLTNPAANADPETGVAFDDPFPAGLLVATPSDAASTCADANVTADAGSGEVTASGILIPVGGSCTITMNVVATIAGTFTNSVTISSGDGGTGNTAMATLNGASPPAIAKSFGDATIPLNGSTTLSFTITNPNPAIALQNVSFTDTLPAGLAVSSPNGLTGSCGGGAITATAGSGSVSLSGATLGDGASCTFSVTVDGVTAGVQTNAVTVDSDTGGTGNTATASVTVVAPPTVSKMFGAKSVPLGGTTSLSFTIGDPNATVDLSGVALTDKLPAGLAVATPNGLTAACGSGTVTAPAGSSTISLSGGTVAAGGSCTFSVNVTGTAAGTQQNTTGNVTSTEGGTGGTASATLHVIAPPHLDKVFGATSVALNGTTSLTFTLTNPAANTDPEQGVSFTDHFPAGLAVANPAGAASTCADANITGAGTPGSTNVTASGILIPVGGSCTISLNVVVTASGTLTNSTTISSTNGGTGNTATATISGASPPTLDMAFGASTVALGGSTTLSFTVTNPNATLALTGVGFTDTLPAGLILATPAGESGTCNGGTISAPDGGTAISLSGASLDNGASCTFSVNVTGIAVGTESNTTSPPTSNEGGNGTPATASIVVVAPPTLTKSFAAASITVGDSTTLSFTVANPNAGTTLTGVGFGDHLPAGLAISTPAAETGSCGGGTISAPDGGSTISLSGAPLAHGASCTFSVSVTATAAGSQVNTTSPPTSNEGGDGTAASATLGVDKAIPAMSTAASATVKAGGQLTDTATISGGYRPGGSIVFKAYGPADSGCTASPAFTSSAVAVSGNGAYTSPVFTVTEAGTYRWIATYSGDSNNAGTAGKCTDTGESVAVSPATPTISTQASTGVTLGGQVTDTATIAGGTAPGGTIAFTLYGAGDTGCTGTPAFTSTPVAVSGNGAYSSPSFKPTATGTYRWVAAYSGDANNAAASTHCGDPNESVTVAQVPTTTTLTASVNPSTLGQPVTFTATVTGTGPTGTVTFNDGSTALGTGTLDGTGTATFTTSTLSQGSHSITAVYGGDASNAPSTSGAVTQVVQATSGVDIAITEPKQGAVYPIGARVAAAYTCGSGPAAASSCAGPVPSGSPINTRRPGRHVFTVTATTAAGRTQTATVTYLVLPVKVKKVIVHADGSVTALVTFPGGGTANFMVTAWDDNVATTADLLQPAQRRFVVGRAHSRIQHAETVTVTVSPNAKGKTLAAHPRYPLIFRFWVSYAPLGGSQTNLGTYGLHAGRPMRPTHPVRHH